jgi:hypothetical protein
VYLETLLTLHRQQAGLPETPYAYPETRGPISKPGYRFLRHVYRNGVCLFLLAEFVGENGETRDLALTDLPGMTARLRWLVGL